MFERQLPPQKKEGEEEEKKERKLFFTFELFSIIFVFMCVFLDVYSPHVNTENRKPMMKIMIINGKQSFFFNVLFNCS